MGTYLRKRIVNLSPLIILAMFMLYVGPKRMEQLSPWGRGGLVGSFVVAFLASASLGIRPKGRVALPFDPAVIQIWARRFWTYILSLNVCAFVVGLAMVVVLREAIHWYYVILAPCTNLVFIIILVRILYPSATKQSTRPDQSDGYS